MHRKTKEESHKLLRPQDLNLWLSRFNQAHPLLADDCMRACEGSTVSWERLFLFGAVRSAAYRKLTVDLFGTGRADENPETQVIHAALAWNNVDDLKFLAGTNEDELKAFDALWENWMQYRNIILRRRETGGDELPAPKPAPKPEPGPTPPIPPEPYGWWDCEKCGERDNPPKLQRCFRCHAPRPGAVEPDKPKKEEPKPDVPKKEEPKQPVDMKKVGKIIAAVIGVVLVASPFIRMIPGVGQVWNWIEPVLRLIEKVFS